MESLKVMANRAGNTLYSAGAAVASVGKEKGTQAYEAARKTQAYQSAAVAATIGAERVKNTKAFEVASSAASVGKVKATTAATSAASVAASAASVGKQKASSAYEMAKNRISRTGP
ncbi:TPA: hypothetical protein N0F65_001639 [Lagenidium giganteum]|uniref:Uncharacterized protein n=1 Tax=Lagenidium giganteum TaxID=4803 RepID=A0AAV2YH37_9STRA|nr:TPA: hypothetical protein N0F65_001639 [Lagenidium giganteum]